MPGPIQPETPPPASGPVGTDNPAPPTIPDHELLRRIGGGSYGEVWLARNVLGEFRAAKVVNRRTFGQDRPYEREFEGIKKYEPVSRTHDSQVDILHVGRNDQSGYFYYVMELADAAEPQVSGFKFQVSSSGSPAIGQPETRNLKPETYTPRTLKHDVHSHGRLPFEECLQIGLALTTALDHLHKHDLVHRDVKPSNIIFINGIPKLADIGLVTDIGEANSLVGTEGYMAPEFPGTPQADLYSLGKVLYEISMGRKGQVFPELPPDWDELAEKESLLELNEVILKACQADLRFRYQSAREMHADLALLQTGKSVKRLHALERRLALVTKLGVTFGALMVIAAGAYLFQRWQTRQVAKEKKIAERLLYMYKDHGFVIDAAEAVEIFGKDVVLSNTPEYALANKLYRSLDLLQRVLVAEAIEERDQDVKSGRQRVGVFSETLDHPRLLLRDDASSLRHEDDCEECKNECYDYACHRESFR